MYGEVKGFGGVKLKQHVFISYSRQNIDFAQRLVEAFSQAHIPFWIDLEGIHHRDHSFERTLRTAIDESFAAVLIATPDSLESDFVQGEIDYVLDQNLDLIVIWAGGESVPRAVPTKLTRKDVSD